MSRLDGWRPYAVGALALQQATEEVKGQLENAKELGDIPKVLHSVRALLEKLNARARTLQS